MRILNRHKGVKHVWRWNLRQVNIIGRNPFGRAVFFLGTVEVAESITVIQVVVSKAEQLFDRIRAVIFQPSERGNAEAAVLNALAFENLKCVVEDRLHHAARCAGSVAGDVRHVASFAEKWDKHDECHDFSVGVGGVEISLVHRIFQPDSAHNESQHRTLFLLQPFVRDAVQICLNLCIPLFQRAVFMDDDPGFPGVVDVHTHLGALLAGDLIVRKVETGFLPIFDPSKALLLIFFQKMVSDADKKQVVSAALAKFFKFCQENRKIAVRADGIAVDNDGAADDSVGDNAVHLLTEI